MQSDLRDRRLGARGVQFGVLVQVLFGVLFAGDTFARLTAVCLGMQVACWCRCCFRVLHGVLLEVLVTARAHFCEIDSRVLWECRLGVLFVVLARAHFCN